MKNNLLFHFNVNKENHTVAIEREFSGPLDLVWDAWTKPEILDLWWAPKPWRSETKHMDFKVGGRRFYAMVSPDGAQKGWQIQEYTSISPKTDFSFFSVFADAEENPHLPGSNWDLNFSEQEGITKVSIMIHNDSLERMEKMIEMGFKEGFTSTLEYLEGYIAERFKLRNELRTTNTPRVTTYLNFPGTTEEAFLFYRSVFKTEFSGKGMQRFGDLPAESGHPPVADAIKNMILHVELPTLGGHVLMATDAPQEMGFTLHRGNTMHICLEPASRAETQRLFDALSEGGIVTVPLADMFFGSFFGECSDKYGINWMFNFKNN
jgi:PhnB protein